MVERILKVEQQNGGKHGLDAASEFLVSEKEVSRKQVKREGMEQNYLDKY